MAACTWDHR